MGIFCTLTVAFVPMLPLQLLESVIAEIVYVVLVIGLTDTIAPVIIFDSVPFVQVTLYGGVPPDSMNVKSVDSPSQIVVVPVRSAVIFAVPQGFTSQEQSDWIVSPVVPALLSLQNAPSCSACVPDVAQN